MELFHESGAGMFIRSPEATKVVMRDIRLNVNSLCWWYFERGYIDRIFRGLVSLGGIMQPKGFKSKGSTLGELAE